MILIHVFYKHMNPRICPKIKHIMSLIFHNNDGDEYGVFESDGREEQLQYVKSLRYSFMK